MILNISKLNKELSAIRVEKQEWTKNMESFKEEKSKLEEQIKSLQEKIKDMEEKHTESKKEEAAVIVAVEESVNKKVVQNLAAIGVAEGTVKEEVVPVTTDMDIYNKFESLSGVTKIEYFKQNERAIYKVMKSLHVKNPPVTSNNKTI